MRRGETCQDQAGLSTEHSTSKWLLISALAEPVNDEEAQTVSSREHANGPGCVSEGVCLCHPRRRSDLNLSFREVGINILIRLNAFELPVSDISLPLSSPSRSVPSTPFPGQPSHIPGG